MRDALRRNRISQETLAARLNLSQQAVSRRLVGDVEFSASQLVTVAEVLHTTVEELLADEKSPALAEAGDSE